MRVKKKKNSIAIYNQFATAILVITLAIVPLVVLLKKKLINNEALNYWNSPINSDFFSYYKSQLILVLSIIALCLMVYAYITKTIAIKKTLMIPVGLLAVCILLSALFSQRLYISVHGFPDRYEGVLVQLSYLVLFAMATTFAGSEKQLNNIIKGLLLSALVIGIIGIFQYFRMDFFQSSLGQALIDPFRKLTDVIKYRIDGSTSLGNAIYSTLYNSNTLGVYISMLFPFVFYLSFFMKSKSQRILLTLMTVLMFINLLGSFSRGSLLGATTGVLVTSLFVGRRLIENWKHLLTVTLLCIGTYFLMNFYSVGEMGLRLETMSSTEQVHLEDQNIDKMKDFIINNNELSIYCTNSILKVQVEGAKLSFYDDKLNKVELNAIDSTGTYEIVDERYREYKIIAVKNLLKIQKGRSFLYFAIRDKSFAFLSSKGEVETLKPINKFGFNGYERIGSGRGYIWSRALPLLKHSLILGSGPDTFAFEFPQDDFIGKLNYMYDAYIIIDKPHNMYLQTAINNGCISLFVMLFIFIMYIVSLTKMLRRTKRIDFYYGAGVSIFAAVIGYLVSGIFTDSSVSTAPVFWVLLGLGVCLNRNLKDIR